MKNIQILEEHSHLKASERYVHVIFYYQNQNTTYDVWVPIEYRRTGLNLRNQIDIDDYLRVVYSKMNPINRKKWKEEQEKFWKSKTRALVTQKFFDTLSKDVKWCCVCCELPNNPNWARRIQAIKEMGYTISTDIKRFCPKCNSQKTHLVLLPIPRAEVIGNGYETFPSKLRERIINTLKNYDAYEGKGTSNHLLPDHKFSEIRWDTNTKAENTIGMTEDEIKDKFQLLTNQRNQQKREVCRTCYQTNKRGTIFGINFFHEGDENWNSSIPKTGKVAESGCRGCPWYDIEEWRNKLNELIKSRIK